MCQIKYFMIFQINDTSRVRSDVFEACLKYTIIAKIAPQWNYVNSYFIQGKEFITSQKKLNAVRNSKNQELLFDMCTMDWEFFFFLHPMRLDIHANETEITMKLDAFSVKQHQLDIADLNINTKCVKEFYDNHRGKSCNQSSANQFQTITANKIPQKWCHILPTLKKGELSTITTYVPQSSPFKDYTQIRRYWKNSYGYRLPETPPQIYYNINFRMISDKIFTSSCFHEEVLKYVLLLFYWNAYRLVIIFSLSSCISSKVRYYLLIALTAIKIEIIGTAYYRKKNVYECQKDLNIVYPQWCIHQQNPTKVFSQNPKLIFKDFLHILQIKVAVVCDYTFTVLDLELHNSVLRKSRQIADINYPPKKHKQKERCPSFTSTLKETNTPPPTDSLRNFAVASKTIKRQRIVPQLNEYDDDENNDEASQVLYSTPLNKIYDATRISKSIPKSADLCNLPSLHSSPSAGSIKGHASRHTFQY
ncbi:hypothetical protein GQR58_010474 [Nymphon striatum]|nr:hypothetical protein GQR58_010474 [Nymphon striatum]